MVKPRERNTRYVDAVMSVPKGSLYPMCGMNLAFDRWAGLCVSGPPSFVVEGLMKARSQAPTARRLHGQG
jgi:hypothetical protein